jgi:hypothetical protein
VSLQDRRHDCTVAERRVHGAVVDDREIASPPPF